MCKTYCEGYSIRRGDWMEIIKQDSEIYETIKHNVRFYYEYHVFNKVNQVKDNVLYSYRKRADYQHILTTTDKPVLKGFHDKN